MQNDDKSTSEKQDNSTPKPEEQKPRPLFSQEEIKDIIKGFVLAWLGGHITIKFPSAEELLARSKLENRKLDYKQATDEELAGKLDTIELISICAGAKPATHEEQQKATGDLFHRILLLRSADRIKGNFVKYSTEERLTRLEEGLKVTNDLVKQLVELHREELGI